MLVKINNQETTLPDGTTLADIACGENLPETGVAMAVNNELAPRGGWDGHVLKDGDDIVILKAFCGG